MERLTQSLIRLVKPHYDVHSSWNADEFDQYLKDLGGKRKPLLNWESYPEEITLSEGFHKELNELRETLTTGNEHLKTLGYSKNMDTLLVPKATVEGNNRNIGARALESQIKKGFLNGVTSNLGAFHTHPNNHRVLDFQVEFSPEDLYFLVDGGELFTLTGVLGSCENILAFKSKETHDTKINPALVSQTVFSEYWYKEYELDHDKQGGVLIARGEYSDSTTLILGIADRHRLVLYAGEVNKPLYRYYPFL